MTGRDRKTFLIHLPYWLGIGADALWAVGLFVPSVFGVLIANPDFNPDLQHRLTMAIGGTLMTGWTFLLLWAVREPIGRRFVILLTAFPVVFGLFMVGLVVVLQGKTTQLWILIKTAVLFATMINSYFLATRVAKRRRSEPERADDL